MEDVILMSSIMDIIASETKGKSFIVSLFYIIVVVNALEDNKLYVNKSWNMEGR